MKLVLSQTFERTRVDPSDCYGSCQIGYRVYQEGCVELTGSEAKPVPIAKCVDVPRLATLVEACIPSTQCFSDNGGSCVVEEKTLEDQRNEVVRTGRCSCSSSHGFSGLLCQIAPRIFDIVTNVSSGNKITATWEFEGNPANIWTISTIGKNGLVYPLSIASSQDEAIDLQIPFNRPTGNQMLLFRFSSFSVAAPIFTVGNCSALPCSTDHGATCSDEENECNCPPGYFGRYCEEDPCARCNPSGSTCSRTGDAAGVCVCHSGLTGDRCDHADNCRIQVDCGNGYMDTTSSSCSNQCKCMDGWVSSQSEAAVNLSQQNPFLTKRRVPTEKELSSLVFSKKNELIPTEDEVVGQNNENDSKSFCSICTLLCGTNQAADENCSYCICAPGYYGPACEHRSLDVHLVFLLGADNFATNKHRFSFLETVAFDLAVVLKVDPTLIVGKKISVEKIGFNYYAVVAVEFRSEPTSPNVQNVIPQSTSFSDQPEVLAQYSSLNTISDAYVAFNRLITLVNTDTSAFYSFPTLSTFVLSYGIGANDPQCTVNCPISTGHGGVIPRSNTYYGGENEPVAPGVIAAIVVVCLIVLGAIGVLVFYIVRRRLNADPEEEGDEIVAQELAAQDQDIFYVLQNGLSDKKRQKLINNHRKSLIAQQPRAVADGEPRLRLNAVNAAHAAEMNTTAPVGAYRDDQTPARTVKFIDDDDEELMETDDIGQVEGQVRL